MVLFRFLSLWQAWMFRGLIFATARHGDHNDNKVDNMANDHKWSWYLLNGAMYLLNGAGIC